jgi:hypothetical protein
VRLVAGEAAFAGVRLVDIAEGPALRLVAARAVGVRLLNPLESRQARYVLAMAGRAAQVARGGVRMRVLAREVRPLRVMAAQAARVAILGMLRARDRARDAEGRDMQAAGSVAALAGLRSPRHALRLGLA